MNTKFSIKTGSVEQAQSIQNDLKEAQLWCNFSLLKPTWLPDDVSITEQSLRPENADHCSSYRTVLTGKDRKLSIKQFLFDFAPPAYDHPSLWRNPQKTAEGEFPLPKAYPLEDNILWIGHDHRRYYGATVGYHRVRVEATVLSGSFENETLFNIFKNLKLVDGSYSDMLKSTTFATLSYQHRFKQPATAVPLSYWTHQRNSSDHHYSKEASSQNLSQLPIIVPNFERFGYTLDSYFEISPESGPVSEYDWVYEAKEKNGAYLRLLLSPPSSPTPIPLPPQKYTQECTVGQFDLPSQTVDVAWLDKQFGPYEAAFSLQGGNALLLAQPAAWTNADWFRSVVNHML
ncbi:MAG: hypothetical protein AAF490_09910 [Chloroflexota bacterium]